MSICADPHYYEFTASRDGDWRARHMPGLLAGLLHAANSAPQPTGRVGSSSGSGPRLAGGLRAWSSPSSLAEWGPWATRPGSHRSDYAAAELRPPAERHKAACVQSRVFKFIALPLESRLSKVRHSDPTGLWLAGLEVAPRRACGS